MEGTVGVLKSSVTVKERMHIGVSLYCTVKSFENKRIVISVAHDIGNDATVIEVEYGAKIDFV